LIWHSAAQAANRRKDMTRISAVRTIADTARGLAKSYGERLRGCNVRNMNPEKAEGLSPELQSALEPLLACIESVSEQIREYNERIENLAQRIAPRECGWKHGDSGHSEKEKAKKACLTK
jgi:transposase